MLLAALIKVSRFFPGVFPKVFAKSTLNFRLRNLIVTYRVGSDPRVRFTPTNDARLNAVCL